jgi:hypothetical protein
MMLLGDVRELEVQAESPQDRRLIAGRKRSHGVADGIDVAGCPRVARAQPNPLLGVE